MKTIIRKHNILNNNTNIGQYQQEEQVIYLVRRSPDTTKYISINDGP